jgi:Cdc6-like AAA superfamily ATPase
MTSKISKVGHEFKDTVVTNSIMNDIDDLRKHGRVASHGEVQMLVGPTGVGKTVLLHRYASHYPSTMTPKGRKTPVLVIDAPDKCTTGEVASQILRGLKDPAPSQGTEGAKVSRVVEHFDRQSVELLIIDESQQVTSIDGFVIGNFIKNLLNQTKSAILIVGLPSVTNLEDMNLQFGDRKRSDIRMAALDWQDRRDRQIYCQMLKAFQEWMMFPISNFNLDDEAFAMRMAFASRGLMRRTVKIIREAEAIGRKLRSETLTIQDFIEGWARLNPDADPRENPFSGNIPDTWKPAADNEGDRDRARGKSPKAKTKAAE